MSELEMLAVGYAAFLLLIVVEAGVSRVRQDGYYTLGELVVNIGHGVVYQVFDHLTKGLVILPFALVSAWVPWEVLPMDAWWAWVVAFLAYDFAIYWAHRHHHEVHLLWAIHGVHHAAEDYNLAAALRQPAFQGLTGWAWRLPLALLMPFDMFVLLVVIDFGYQFLQHTRYVGKLGPVEWVFNTPSHHRVHHGVEEKYLDKNYGGMLIIWDRLFGTFQEEEQEPTFGVTKPLNTLNAVWGNLAIFQELLRASGEAVGAARIGVWLRGPGALARLAPAHRYVPPPAPELAHSVWQRAYVMVTAAVIPPALAWMLLAGGEWSPRMLAAVSVWLVWSVMAAGALLEGRRWALAGEWVRMACGVALITVAL